MSPAPSLTRSLRTGVVAITIGVGALALGLLVSGYDPVLALGAMWRGAFGTPDTILSALLPRVIPLLFIGLGLGLAFQGGVLNIGAEGQFYLGAIAATWLGLITEGWPRVVALPTVLVGAVVAGMCWTLIPLLLKLRFGVLEVISTLLLNFVADSLVSYMVQGPLQEPQHIYPQSATLPLSARLPQLAGTRLHLGLAIGLALAAAFWIFQRGTLLGFQLRATGLNPRAARVAGGVNTDRVFAMALLTSGAMAGLAGGAEVSGTTFALFQNLSPGYGFTGIAVALLARLHPIGIVLTATLFAALEAGASAMQREAGVPAIAVYVVEATIIMVILLGNSQAFRSTDGQPSPADGQG